MTRGAAFEELARSESIDPSAARGGLIGPVALGELRPELRDAVAVPVTSGGSFGSSREVTRAR